MNGAASAMDLAGAQELHAYLAAGQDRDDHAVQTKKLTLPQVAVRSASVG